MSDPSEQSRRYEITISDSIYELIRQDFKTEPLGESEIKGFGPRQIYRLVSLTEGLDLTSI